MTCKNSSTPMSVRFELDDIRRLDRLCEKIAEVSELEQPTRARLICSAMRIGLLHLERKYGLGPRKKPGK